MIIPKCITTTIPIRNILNVYISSSICTYNMWNNMQKWGVIRVCVYQIQSLRVHKKKQDNNERIRYIDICINCLLFEYQSWSSTKSFAR